MPFLRKEDQVDQYYVESITENSSNQVFSFDDSLRIFHSDGAGNTN
jgi:hypothetical protein